MKKYLDVFVVGKGAREHAIVSGLAKSKLVGRIWCAPGNPGIGEETLVNGGEVTCVSITDANALLEFAETNSVDLTIFGSERLLVNGIADQFREKGLSVFGPDRFGAKLEGSKAFFQQFAEKHSLPVALGKWFMFDGSARRYAESLGGFCAVKANGLCDGKGVIICHNLEEANAAISDMLISDKFGGAGRAIVIQELLEGFELSLHILCDGKSWKLLPSAMDHKRLLEENKGSQTGGMGAVSPHPFVSQSDHEKMAGDIMPKFLEGCAKEGIVYRGMLFFGMMLTAEGPKILELNVRPGDPETQVILPRVKSDVAELLLVTATGRLGEVPLEVHDDRAAICVVVASPGYPENPIKGKIIKGLSSLAGNQNPKVFHAGTRWEGDFIVTDGGRVLGVTAWDFDLDEARHSAYKAVSELSIEGGYQFRLDIGGFPLGVRA